MLTDRTSVWPTCMASTRLEMLEDVKWLRGMRRDDSAAVPPDLRRSHESRYVGRETKSNERGIRRFYYRVEVIECLEGLKTFSYRWSSRN